MNSRLSILRPSLAWFLLLAVCFQQLAGRLYVSRVYSVEIESRMSPHEEAVATMLKAKTGIDIQVTLLDESQSLSVYRTGYNAPVVFSKEIDGETYCYAIGHEPVKTVQYSYLVNNQQAAKGIPYGESVLVNLFSDYCFDSSSLQRCRFLQDRHNPVFPKANLMPNGAPAVPYPPPRSV